jgi:Holliday junction resolvase
VPSECGDAERFILVSSGGNVKGIDFEKEVASQLVQLGWSVQHTAFSNDYGADLICTVQSEKLIVQCKDYSSKPIGISAIQEVLGAIAHYGGTFGALIYRGRVTQNAIKLAISSNILVISIEDIEVGSKLDRIIDREEIIEAERRKKGRDEVRLKEIQNRNNILRRYEEHYIAEYKKNNFATWNSYWTENNNIYNEAFNKFQYFERKRYNYIICSFGFSLFSFMFNVFAFSAYKEFSNEYRGIIMLLSLTGMVIGIYHWFTEQPKPKRSIPAKFENYVDSIIQQNKKEIYKNARLWAEQNYKSNQLN